MNDLSIAYRLHDIGLRVRSLVDQWGLGSARLHALRDCLAPVALGDVTEAAPLMRLAECAGSANTGEDLWATFLPEHTAYFWCGYYHGRRPALRARPVLT
jgi:hypothetical protein